MTENTTTMTASEDTKAGISERFTNMVMARCNDAGMKIDMTDKMRRLINGYFIHIDQTLTDTEADRVRKNANNKDHSYDNTLPCVWTNVDLVDLAQDLAHYALVGLDMSQDNTLFPIPFKDNKAGKYVITLMEGYNGIRYQAEKYALIPFRDVTVEVVYQNDVFQPIKKGRTNPCDTYVFDIPCPFDRGEPVGVFGYIEYADSAKNKLVFFSKADVLKRKPPYAAPEFWGGKKTVWENGKKVEKELEGWVPEMFSKTMKREIYGAKNIPRDPDKIDESYLFIQHRERQYAEMALEAEVAKNANGAPLVLPDDPPAALPPSPQETIDLQTGEITKQPVPVEGVPSKPDF